MTDEPTSDANQGLDRAHDDAGDALVVSRDALTAMQEQTAVLVELVAEIRGVGPDVRLAVRNQKHSTRIMLATLAIAGLMFGTVVWQRQSTAQAVARSRCESQNYSRSVSRASWTVVWKLVDDATPDGPQQDKVDAVKAQQTVAYAPLNCS